MKFKVGDKVICINDGYSNLLELNKIYTVSEVEGYFPFHINVVDDDNKLVGVAVGWSEDRFKLYTPYKNLPQSIKEQYD